MDTVSVLNEQDDYTKAKVLKLLGASSIKHNLKVIENMLETISNEI